MIDPRNVKIPGHNLTIIYMEDGKVFQSRVLDMAHAFTPYEIFEVTANQEQFGIYNDEGVEIWPSDCVSLGIYLDNQARKQHTSDVKVRETKPSKGANRVKKVSNTDLEDW